jgi:hypothetical protein
MQSLVITQLVALPSLAQLLRASLCFCHCQCYTYRCLVSCVVIKMDRKTSYAGKNLCFKIIVRNEEYTRSHAMSFPKFQSHEPRKVDIYEIGYKFERIRSVLDGYTRPGRPAKGL